MLKLVSVLVPQRRRVLLLGELRHYRVERVHGGLQ